MNEDRKVFYVDVGKMSTKEAQKLIDKMMVDRGYKKPSKFNSFLEFLALFFMFNN